ncbi:MAG TPA: hypothetical protein DEF47_21835 [Herpetosiphon sp.]|uniref:Uncharacterized protein n=1 Tax=Herpetosiphon aurantiacus (strain ATCC 23779 / DSM 785 / 114-95) TaxID=316274 RepID=A9AVZ8_HERA2|nr:hypothetical protein [Herpetosiphon sp.]ABX03236.1 hypothetical protein Haur_0588 [Herpetosiphon aurantiacus DSM 785]HBW52531.1 hypothetical protein [Herpetosiphon sp.]
MSDRPNEDKKLHDPKATVQLTADDLAAMRAELQQEKDKANQFATARLSEADIAPATNKKLENPYATVQLNPEEMAALRAEAQRVKAEAQAAQAAQAAPVAPAPDNISSMRGGAVANTPPAPAAPQSFPDQTVIMSPGQARAQYGNAPVDQSYAPPAQQQYAPPAQQQQYAPPAQQQQYAPPPQQYAPPAQQQYAPPPQPGYGQNYQNVQQTYNPPAQTGFSAPPAPLNTNENFFQKYGVYLLIGFGAMLIVAAILLLVIG